MKIYRNASIRQRLTFIILAICTISIVVTTLAISVIGVFSLRQSIISDLEISAAIAGDRNRVFVEFNNPGGAKDNLSVLGVKPYLVQACLYDAMGLYFASYTNSKNSEEKCPENVGTYLRITPERIKLMQTIESGNNISGYIFLESTFEEVDKYIKKQSTIAFTVAMVALLISYFLAVGLQRTISAPILSLADVARRITVHKDYHIRAEPLGNIETDNTNELVILTHSFNTMLSEIEERNEQLSKQNIALAKARDAAESSNRAKSQFLANISHELRTPLNAIIGFSSILMNQLFGPLGDGKYLEYANDINESGTHLLDIINDILDLSKAEAGKLELAYEEMHVAKAIAKCVTIMAERAGKGQITIATNVPKMLPPLIVDRLRFIQIVLNILSNAVKFTEAGGKIDIDVRAEEVGDGMSNFIIEIKDTGIGMSEADIEKAFQSFGQVDSGLNRKYEGTGLGLPLTRKLMELHHGQLKIASTPGQGTSVSLIFPAVPPVDVNLDDAS
jgi:signal transduction histidine kinase